MAVNEGDLLWQPSDEMKRNSNLRAYLDWLAREKGLHFDDYDRCGSGR